MRTITEYQREIGEVLMPELEQIRAVATAEKRDLTLEEVERAEEIIAQIEQLEKYIATERRYADTRDRQPEPGEDPLDLRLLPDPDPATLRVVQPDQFRSLGEQLIAVAFAGGDGGRVDPRLIQQRAATGLSVGVPSDGGFLVQTEFANALFQLAHDTGVLPGRCSNLPISSGKNSIKLPAIDETSRADGSRWGGIRAYWKDEAAEKTKSKPQFREMDLKLNKLIGLCYATDELIEDATALGAYITRGFGDEFGFKLDDALINGTGAGQPLGIMNAPCLVTVSAETGQTAATIIYENIVNMWSRMWARSRPNAVWLINQDIEPQLFTMSLAVGTGGAPVYLPPGGASQSPYGSLYGRPVIPIEQCQTLGTTGDIILGDFAQYQTITKGGIQSDMSIHVRFVYDESVFRFVLRFDGQPLWNSALTPFKGTNTQSPFIALETRS